MLCFVFCCFAFFLSLGYIYFTSILPYDWFEYFFLRDLRETFSPLSASFKEHTRLFFTSVFSPAKEPQRQVLNLSITQGNLLSAMYLHIFILLFSSLFSESCLGFFFCFEFVFFLVVNPQMFRRLSVLCSRNN